MITQIKRANPTVNDFNRKNETFLSLPFFCIFNSNSINLALGILFLPLKKVSFIEETDIPLMDRLFSVSV